MLTTAGTVAVVLLLLGGLLTRVLHFSTGALSIASGAILVLIAIRMVFGRNVPATGSLAVEGKRIRCNPPLCPWECLASSTQPGSCSW